MLDFEQDVTKLPEPNDPAKTYQMWQSTQAEYDRLNPALEAMSSAEPHYTELYQECLWLSLAILHFRNHYYYLLRQLYPPVYSDYPSPEEIAEWKALMARPKRETILEPYVPDEDDEEDEEE